MDETSTDHEEHRHDEKPRDSAEFDPHDPKSQLWGMLLMASGRGGDNFTDLVDHAQKAVITAMYDTALRALRP